MYYTVPELVAKGIVPERYARHMLSKCECGEPIIRKDNLKETKCSGAWCYKHMAARGDKMLKYLKIKNIAAARCEEIILNKGLLSHFDILQYVLQGVKPEMYLWEVAKMASIENYADNCEQLFAGYQSFEDYFNKERNIPKEVLASRYDLITGEKYFDIKKPLSKTCLYVALHGRFKNWSDRSDFVKYMNAHCGQFIKTVEKGDRVSNDYLIVEDQSGSNRKLVTARKHKIPMVTPEEYEAIILDYIERKLMSGEFKIPEEFKEKLKQEESTVATAELP